MGRPLKLEMSSEPVNGALASFDEWWAVEGTVTEAFDGFGFVGFDLAAGKCLPL